MAPLRTVLITTALALTTAVAHADSSVYIGAGVGRGHVSDIYHTGEIPGLGPFFHIDNATAWDAIIGLRPVQPFAVEATYIDLGSDTYHWNNGQVSYNAHAAALYAIGFLPLPLPHLEVYGKAGLAQWQLNGKTYISIVPPRSDEATQFAWGAGVQLHYGPIGVRLEYDRFQIVQASDAYLYTLGVTYRLW